MEVSVKKKNEDAPRVEAAGHVICERCNQPRSEHSAKFGRCPSWAGKPPGTFIAAKNQPRDIPTTQGDPPPGSPEDVAAHPWKEGGDEQKSYETDSAPEPETLTETVNRLASDVGAVAERGNCFNCQKEVEKDSYCHGCKAFICDDCDKSAAAGGMFGPHAKEQHLEEPEFDDENDDDENDIL